jgi:hypothetical protein
MSEDVSSLIPIEELPAELAILESGTLDDEELLKRVRKIHTDFRISVPVFHPGTTIYRAVRVTEKPLYRMRISYPPPDRIRVNGRLNRAGEPIFYGSLDQFASCLCECRCAEGQQFAVSVWKTTEPIALAHFGYSREVMDEVKAKRDLPPWSESKGDTERNALLRAWQARVFTRVVSEGEEHLYRLTIALRDFALSAIAASSIAHIDPNLPRSIGGITYPAIAMWLLGDNVALLPSVVDKSLRLQEVMFLTLESIVEALGENNDKQWAYNLRIHDTAKLFRSDGRLVWNQESTALSVSPLQFTGTTLQPA